MKTKFAILFTTFFIGLGFGLSFPIFSPLLLDPASHFFEESLSLETRGLFLGCLVSLFAIGQLIGNPLLGSASDKYGRKKILMYAISVAIVGYSIAALAIWNKSILFLIIGRFLVGIAAGGYAVAQTAIADISEEDEKQKAKQFALLAMTWGIGFIIGPSVGAQFVSLETGGWHIPFVMGALMGLVNLWVLKRYFTETLIEKSAAPLSFKTGILEISKAFKEESIKGVLIISFLFAFGYNFFNEFSSVHLNQNLSFGPKELASFFAMLGIWQAISLGVLVRPVLNRFDSKKIIPVTLLGLGGAFLSMLFVKSPFGLYLLIPCIAFFQAFVQPCAASLISGSSDKKKQGEILGINGGVQMVAMSIAPFFTGTLVAIFPSFPLLFASFCMLAAGLFFIFYYRPKKVFDSNKLE